MRWFLFIVPVLFAVFTALVALSGCHSVANGIDGTYIGAGQAMEAVGLAEPASVAPLGGNRSTEAGFSAFCDAHPGKGTCP